MAYNFEKLEALLKEKGVNKGEIEEIITPLKNMARKRRYGLVWEEPGETSYDKDQAEKALEEAFAFLKEVPERRIEKAPEKPMNLLIEGDNYHSLKALQYTHKGLVDVIYIDPPYNTGNNDFVYNDSYVDSEDSWRHSSWLSFMNKRLKLAKELMSEDGVIFISIDDNEMAQLKLLCDQVFGERNKMGVFVVETANQTSDSNKIKNNDFLLVYAKNENYKFSLPSKKQEARCTTGKQNQTQHVLEFPKGIPVVGVKDGIYKDTRKTGGNEDIELIEGPIIIENGFLMKPIKLKARWSNPNDLKKMFAKLNSSSNEKVFNKFGKELLEIYFKGTRFQPQMIKSGYDMPSTIVLGKTQKGGQLLRDILGVNSFSYPKHTSLLKFILELTPSNSTVLDFFAGSGTTGHAVMELNKEDGGNRQFILATNNENNIAEEVTYERLRRVIEGYTTPKNKVVEGIPNNLSYYKVDLIDDSGDSDQNRLQAIQNAVDLIAIKEQTYHREDKNSLSVLRKEDKVVYVVTDFFSLLDEDMDEIVSSLMQEPETEKVLYTNYAEYAQEQILYRGEYMPEELLQILK